MFKWIGKAGKGLGKGIGKVASLPVKGWLKVPKDVRYKAYKALAKQGIKVAEKKFKNR